MTQHGVNLIKCDMPECDNAVAMPIEMVRNGAVKGDDVVQWAIKDGWTHIGATAATSSLDICPVHSEEDE